ncbi:MAG: hypothetical protein A2Y73_05965 [Chloroflexi bacterium RBG_13_56_8]|nr:MAG: hypothetical protein A2Y73_05965 [Chloroflexi bacterium RBG_13_56_8]
MGETSVPLPVKLIMPMFTGYVDLFWLAEEALAGYFGEVDYRSALLPFDHTDYYQREFGPSLQRQFIAFQKLIDPARLPEVKRITNALEERWSEEGQRRINLDPGYISASKLVLATTKNHSHRIYLGQGIYGEVTLTYQNKAFRPWPWTYPDYQSQAYLDIMQAIRGIYMQQIKKLSPGESSTPR